MMILGGDPQLAYHTLLLAGLYVLCLLMGCFTNAIVVVAFTATKELFPVQIAGTATGAVRAAPVPRRAPARLNAVRPCSGSAGWRTTAPAGPR